MYDRMKFREFVVFVNVSWIQKDTFPKGFVCLFCRDQKCEISHQIADHLTDAS